ncbi:endonuclease YncB(thermonuclease family) [Phenylobacterium haematophilum]|uniref:Endonuclease YncB(Thermonuclease family) n=1 Tax=Phenylobacterium haematophilum TaxID=98513 RepID=A0A839ZX02_9CAUL|nr:thermonuclease family protein [Phenylobacterium haematophilum]MBB3890574.1 endonuclease YncB(thermonuclease family) [Phenylobacterium haematophilum]
MTVLNRLAVAIALSLASAGSAEPIVGRAVVVDGDTFDVGRTRIRLWGIDAPEDRQTCTDMQQRAWPCGDRARNALRARLAAGSVRCEPQYLDRGGRQVAICTIGGRDLARQLVEQGWALDYPQFSRGVFQAAERQARVARVGVWRGRITPPWQWRSQHEVRTERGQQADRRCRIKGNINAEGQRIAHAPGQRDYATVRIDAGRGERWFCTLPAARAAGWRPAER